MGAKHLLAPLLGDGGRPETIGTIGTCSQGYILHFMVLEQAVAEILPHERFMQGVWR